MRSSALRVSLLSAASLAFAADPAPLEKLFAPPGDPSSPGLAVLVRQDGRTLFEHGYGVRDRKSLARIDSATNFRLASFTKQFTAMSIMLLVHDGKLRYDQTLTEIFPGFPSWGRTITVRHLLTHTGGLPDYEDLMDAFEKGKPAVWTTAHQIQDREVLDLLEREQHPRFAPGTSWEYSNSGYVVLGLIVAKVSGQPFDAYLRARIFEPLHMDRTLAFVAGKSTVAARAFGHSKRNGEFVDSDQSPTSATLGDGGVYSNLDDLAKWDAALGAHTLLGEKEMQPALTPAKLANGAPTYWPSTPGGDNLAPGKPVRYGFGWFLDPYRGERRMWHSGSTSGFRTVIARFPDRRLTVIILCNRTDLDPVALAGQAADVLWK